MRYCSQCQRLTAGEPLYCSHCGSTYNVRLCPARHPNPRSAEVCSECGSRDLSTPAPRYPLWLRPLLLLAATLPGLVLALVLVLIAVGLIRQVATNGQIQSQLVILLLLFALLWWLYIQLPHFIQKMLRSLWTRKKRDRH